MQRRCELCLLFFNRPHGLSPLWEQAAESSPILVQQEMLMGAVHSPWGRNDSDDEEEVRTERLLGREYFAAKSLTLLHNARAGLRAGPEEGQAKRRVDRARTQACGAINLACPGDSNLGLPARHRSQQAPGQRSPLPASGSRSKTRTEGPRSPPRTTTRRTTPVPTTRRQSGAPPRAPREARRAGSRRRISPPSMLASFPRLRIRLPLRGRSPTGHPPLAHRVWVSDRTPPVSNSPGCALRGTCSRAPCIEPSGRAGGS